MDPDLLQLIVVVVVSAAVSITINVAVWYGIPWLWRRAFTKAEAE